MALRFPVCFYYCVYLVGHLAVFFLPQSFSGLASTQLWLQVVSVRTAQCFVFTCFSAEEDESQT